MITTFPMPTQHHIAETEMTMFITELDDVPCMCNPQFTLLVRHSDSGSCVVRALLQATPMRSTDRTTKIVTLCLVGSLGGGPHPYREPKLARRP